MSVVGVAKIASVVGSGKYTITQQFYDTVSNTYKDAEAGLVGAPASDLNAYTGWSVDDPVAFRMLETFDGKRQAVITGSAISSVIADEANIHAATASGETTISHIRDTNVSFLWTDIIAGGISKTQDVRFDANNHIIAMQDFANDWFDASA